MTATVTERAARRRRIEQDAERYLDAAADSAAAVAHMAEDVIALMRDGCHAHAAELLEDASCRLADLRRFLRMHALAVETAASLATARPINPLTHTYED